MPGPKRPAQRVSLNRNVAGGAHPNRSDSVALAQSPPSAKPTTDRLARPPNVDHDQPVTLLTPGQPQMARSRCHRVQWWDSGRSVVDWWLGPARSALTGLVHGNQTIIRSHPARPNPWW